MDWDYTKRAVTETALVGGEAEEGPGAGSLASIDVGSRMAVQPRIVDLTPPPPTKHAFTQL